MKSNERFFSTSKDFRDPYSRDRDRIIHARSFRKLEYKTQVFLNQEGDFFRTRLTHSLEVSQIARTIARELGLQEALAEAIALAHDLGHTPFGHVGGDELDKVLKNKGYQNGFEHNFQSFRVVTKLEKRYQQFDGLNLTYATLEGILKHSYPYKKPFLTPWHEEIFRLDYHPCLEALIVDRADEIAYISHDLDDGLHSGLISFEDLQESSFAQFILEKVKEDKVSINNKKLYRYAFIKHLINHLVYALLDFSKSNVIDNTKVLSSTLLANKKIPIGFDKWLEKDILILKRILFNKLYQHEKIARKMYAGKMAIRGLFEAFYDDTSMLTQEYRERLSKDNKHRVIADFIAELSDRNAMKIYNEIYGRNL